MMPIPISQASTFRTVCTTATIPLAVNPSTSATIAKMLLRIAKMISTIRNAPVSNACLKSFSAFFAESSASRSARSFSSFARCASSCAFSFAKVTCSSSTISSFEPQ